MKLKAGKSYYRRDGGVESIVRVDAHCGYNVHDEDWDIDGKFGVTKDESRYDLIAEVPSADQAFTETAEAGLSVVKANGGSYKAGKSTIKLCPTAHIANLERQLTEAREQRDRLVEALRNKMGQKTCGHTYDCICADDMVKAALKGANHE